MKELFVVFATVTSFLWIAIPFRRRTSKYFYFFAVLGLSAAYVIISEILPLPVPTRALLAVSSLSLIGLFPKFFKHYFYPLIIIGLLLYMIGLYIPIIPIQQITLVNFLIIFSVMIIIIFKEYRSINRINFFSILVSLYCFLNVLKFVFLLLYREGGLVEYLTMSIAQTFLGIVFLLTDENNPKLLYPIPK